MESKTCISTLSAEDLRFHLLSTNKLPAGIPEKLLVIVKGNYSQLTSHLKLFHGFLKTTGHSNRTLYCGNADCKAGFNSFAKYRDHVINCLVKDPQPDVRQQDSFHQANATADKTTQRLARFFLELRAKHNVSHSAIDFIAKNIDTIFKDVAQFCDLETNLTLTNIEKATSKLNSHQKRIRYFTSNMGFVEPVAKAHHNCSDPSESLSDIDWKTRLISPDGEKKNLGEAIVAAFPCLGINVDGKFIVKNHAGRGQHRTLLQSKKTACHETASCKENADYIFNEAECQFKVEWLKSHPPGGDNDTVIIEYSKATFGYRQKEIKQTLTEPGLIMKEYPRFKDFQNGSLVMCYSNTFEMFQLTYFYS
ncbi:hypothetical protein OUZ56_013445 [Daphnia magna]|uniref:C2H2-type domain-containing protein n=1 Tax=Daphnia magna TaxID=35525 RepID=A0ABQ9Z5W9_9CRUS|nr:hypothetical protein OUZ56_013445 [Daphnia magna]